MAESKYFEEKESDYSDFKVMLVYANSPMDNLFPVSVSTISGILRQLGFTVQLFDTTFYPKTTHEEGGGERGNTLQVAEFDYDEVGIKFKETDMLADFREAVLEFSPNLIALSTVEPTHLKGLSLLSQVRDLDIPTLVGGVFSIFDPEYAIASPEIDMVCIGEGEFAIAELCKRMFKGISYDDVKDLWIKKADGKVIKNEKSSELVDLDSLPALDFSVFEEKRIYRPMSGKMYKMAPIEFSRGCIYKCTYCSAPGFDATFADQGKWLRNKSISNIMDEMRYYIDEYGINYFYFVSETFLGMPKARFDDFCDGYSKIGIPFWFNTRPETISTYKIKRLEDINCHRMSIGIECGNEEYRRNMLKRPVSNGKTISACNLVSDSSIELSVNNIIGMPDETREMIFDTIELNREISADSYSCLIFQPYRGTELFTYCVEKGYYDKERLALDSTAASPLNQTVITKEEIKRLEKTFPLYVKLPREKWDEVYKIETNQPGSDILYEKLKQEFLLITEAAVC